MIYSKQLFFHYFNILLYINVHKFTFDKTCVIHYNKLNYQLKIKRSILYQENKNLEKNHKLYERLH